MWPSVQPRADQPPNWEVPGDGCLRGRAPCGPFRGIRDTLEAVRSEQQAGHGFDVAVVIYGTPAWAAHGPEGCERAGTTSWSRPITPQGLRAYRALIRSLLDLGRSVGVPLRWWSPWNEPNHPAFISPQRERCEVSSPTLAPAVYAQLVRAAKAQLAADSQPHDLVLGELAGTRGPGPRGTGVAEFVDALPDDVACSAAVWAQHAYAQPGPRGSEVGPIAQLEHALDRRPCTRDKPIWVTETGVGAAHAGHRRDTSPAALKAQCRLMARTLSRWYRDPRVTAAFQYTFREDNAFPVGLADPTLTSLYPVYDLWKAWGGTRAPDGPEPALPGGCSG